MKQNLITRFGKLVGRMRKILSRLRTKRRFVRYSLLVSNLLLLAGVGLFVLQGNAPNGAANMAMSTRAGTSPDPLDQISTSDIAVNLAQMTKLAETPAVTNQADSASTELAVSAGTTVVTKPQAVGTDLKSSKDIITYTTQPGDTIASIAAKFNVTSESILWSNNVMGNVVAVGTKLLIPPVTGIVYTVKTGDTPDSLAQKFRASREEIVAYNDAELSGLKPGQQVIIPNGQQAVSPSRSGGAYTGSFGIGTEGFSATYGYNGYDRGFCTWYVANRRAEIGRPLPSNLGDAWTWDDRATAAGFRVDNVPAVGAAVVTKTSKQPGHVAFVEAVNADGSIWISEMNSRGQKSMTDSTPAGGFNRVDYKLISASQARSFNYIH